MGRVFITGATGMLGQTLIEELFRSGHEEIAAFVVKGDKLERELPPSVERLYGNILDTNSISSALKEGDAVLHLAALVSLEAKDNEKMRLVNVLGTQNVVDAAFEKGCSKFVYVSTSHVLGYKKTGLILESDFGGKTENIGAYETTKKEATAYVFQKAKEGLNASVVFPSGIIGDRDFGRGPVTTMLAQLASGKIPFFVKGGYAFVDVHDVARVIIAAMEKGRPGEGYLASGGYMSLEDIDLAVHRRYPHLKKSRLIPMWLAYFSLPFMILRERFLKKKALYTYMSLKTVRTKAFFSTEKTTKELGIVFTPLQESIDRCLAFIEKTTTLK